MVRCGRIAFRRFRRVLTHVVCKIPFTNQPEHIVYHDPITFKLTLLQLSAYSLAKVAKEAKVEREEKHPQRRKLLNLVRLRLDFR